MQEPTVWKVLVVEDRAGISASLLRSRADFHVSVAHRVQAVEKLFRDQPSSAPFQAVLLDLSLADIADPMGVDAFRRVRTMAPGLPIIVLAPVHGEDTLPALSAEGAFACLPRQSTTVEVLAWTLRQAVLRTRAEARRYKELFDSVPIGILLAAGRRVAMANPAALKNLGYEEGDLSRISVLDLFPASMRSSLESALDACVAGEAREASFNASLVRKDGTPAAAHVFLKGALLNDAPALALYLAFTPAEQVREAPSAADPAEPTRSAAPREPAPAASSQAGTGRTAHPGDKLQALGRMAASIAHDFNNLFTTINGYSDHLLGLPGAEGTMARGLKAIRKAGEAAASMTRGLMAFSHPGSGGVAAIKVDAAVDENAPMLSSLLGGAVQLRIRPGAGPAAARLEPGQLETILANLCANAKEAMPKGGMVALATQIMESAEGEEFTHLQPRSGGPYAVITVRDTGTGMEPDVLDRLFEPNFSTKAGPKGRGYGLAAVYGMVSEAGGGLSVTSAPDQGSAFRVWLPLAGASLPAAGAKPAPKIANKSNPQDTHAAPQAEPASAVAEPDTALIPSAVEAGARDSAHGRVEILGEDTVDDGKPRILVVEDEPSLRDMLRAVLERYGFEVEEANSGEDAEEQLEGAERFPDLLVTDVLLRDGLGTELAARLRARRPSLRVLFISGHSLETLADQGIRIAAGEFLEKPFTPSQLGLKAKSSLSPDRKPA